MWIISIALTATLASCVWAKPQPPQAVASAGPETTPIAIISQSENSNPDGSFSYSFETANGIKVEESGVQKPNPNPKPEEGNETIQVVNGSFTYTDPNGTQISLRYVADENGFQPTGDHLPTPPPIPDEIQKSLALIAQNRQNAEVAVTPKV